MFSIVYRKERLFLETLRKYSTVGTLIRSAKEDYNIPDSKHVIPAGTQIWIPVYAIHNDEGLEKLKLLMLMHFIERFDI